MFNSLHNFLHYNKKTRLVVILNSKIEQKVKQLCQDSPPLNDLKNHTLYFFAEYVNTF